MLGGDIATSSAIDSRIASSLGPYFSLLLSSVDAAHCRFVHNVAASFIHLLSRLVTTSDLDFTIKVVFSAYFM